MSQTTSVAVPDVARDERRVPVASILPGNAFRLAGSPAIYIRVSDDVDCVLGVGVADGNVLAQDYAKDAAIDLGHVLSVEV